MIADRRVLREWRALQIQITRLTQAPNLLKVHSLLERQLRDSLRPSSLP